MSMKENTNKEMQKYIKDRIIVSPDGCWIWQKSFSDGRYAQCMFGGKNYRVHRLSFLVFIGNIQDGNVIDHLCGNVKCVNPKHLEQVSQKENLRRSSTARSSVNSQKEFCFKGHRFTPENTRYYRNQRLCRKCCARRSLEWYHKNIQR